MQNKKPVSQQRRNEIKEAIDSLPGLLIEHVSFQNNEDNMEQIPPHKKYIPSAEKQAAEQKKRRIIYGGVLLIIAVIVVMMIVNLRTMAFDAKNITSSDEALLYSIKNDYQEILGKIKEDEALANAPATTSSASTTPADDNSILSALQALFKSVSTTTSTAFVSSTTEVSATTTTSTVATSTP